MACLFCRIASKEVPAALIHEDEEIVAFLDLYPIRPGHLQIIPRAHHACFDDLPPPLLSRIAVAGQAFARALKAVTGAPRIAFLFTGGDVPHVHAHLVPMHEKTDITSRRYIAEESLTFRSTPRAGAAELEEMAQRLRAAAAAGARRIA